MRTEKQELRRALKQTRQNIPKVEVNAKSHAIAEKLIASVNWADIKNLHIYSALPEWNEVQTEPIIEYAQAQWPGIEITVAPTAKNEVPPKRQFDLIIVPCLAFDEELYRLGLGAGFYDRFLAGQTKAIKIGVAYSGGFVKSGLPREPHDIRLDAVVTEDRIYGILAA